MTPRSRTKEYGRGDDPVPKRLCQRCGLDFHPRHHQDLTCPPCLRAIDRKRTGRRGAA